MAITSSAIDQVGTRNDGRRLGLALLVIATAQLMVVLDATIVNVALPHIQTALGFSGSGLEWVVNAYALTLGGLLLLGGRAGDQFGRRRMFVTGLLLFSAASLVGGLATSQAWLLAARVVLPGTAGRIRVPGRFDLAGAITGTGGVAALVYGLSQAATSPDGTSHWGDASVLATLTASVVLLTAFAVIEARSRHALMPVRLLRSRDRAGAIVMMLAVGTIVSGVFFFITLRPGPNRWEAAGRPEPLPQVCEGRLRRPKL